MWYGSWIGELVWTEQSEENDDEDQFSHLNYHEMDTSEYRISLIKSIRTSHFQKEGITLSMEKLEQLENIYNDNKVEVNGKNYFDISK